MIEILNASQSRRAARCRNFAEISDPLPVRSANRFTAREHQKEVSAALAGWTMSGPAGGVYLFGPAGVGKTLMAGRCALIFRQRELGVLFVKAKRALDELRDYDDHANVDYWRDRLATADVLILDDLGAHRSTDYAIEELVAIFDHRDQHDLPTLITTNLDGVQLADVLGDRLADRVRGLCQSLHLDGESQR